MDSRFSLTPAAKQQSADQLARLLASTYMLYLKSQNFHWNVESNAFFMLHGLFERHYEELAEAVDKIAERIRALDLPAPATTKAFQKLSVIAEDEENRSGQAMLCKLSEDHQVVIDLIRQAIGHLKDGNDEATINLLIERLEEHEKMAWMLKSHRE